MTHEEDVGDMPIWKDHEHRLTKVETIVGGFGSQIEGMERSMDRVQQVIEKGNSEQKDQLDMFYAQMANEFFDKKKTTHNTKNKLLLKLTGAFVGAGGVVYVVIDLIFKNIGGM